MGAEGPSIKERADQGQTARDKACALLIYGVND